MRLRDVESAAVLSRRGVLWRTGLAAVAGIGVLSALDEQNADAADNGNFILGQSNLATHTTSLAPTGAAVTPLFNINGAALSATQTAMEVNGPSGGAALYVTGASTATTVGVAISVLGQGTATGVYSGSGSGVGVHGASTSGSGVSGTSNTGPGVLGSSSSNDGVRGTTVAKGKNAVHGADTGAAPGGVGVLGSSSHGIGVKASSGTGTALYVAGKTHFSRSGSGSVAAGNKSVNVNVAGLTSGNLVLATLQKNVSGVVIAAAVSATGHFTLYLNKATPTATKFAWMVIN